MKRKSLNSFKKTKTVNVLTNKQVKQVKGGAIGSSDVSEIEFISSKDIGNL